MNVQVFSPATLLIYIKNNNYYSSGRFKTLVTFQNCGRDTAFIRILAPNVYTMRIKTIPRGTQLAPGLKIARSVKYTYHFMDMINTAYLPIYINGTFVEFKLFVSESTSNIKVSPSVLEFGQVDLGQSSEEKYVTLTNEGKV